MWAKGVLSSLITIPVFLSNAIDARNIYIDNGQHISQSDLLPNV